MGSRPRLGERERELGVGVEPGHRIGGHRAWWQEQGYRHDDHDDEVSQRNQSRDLHLSFLTPAADWRFPVIMTRPSLTGPRVLANRLGHFAPSRRVLPRSNLVC